MAEIVFHHASLLIESHKAHLQRLKGQGLTLEQGSTFSSWLRMPENGSCCSSSWALPLIAYCKGPVVKLSKKDPANRRQVVRSFPAGQHPRGSTPFCPAGPSIAGGGAAAVLLSGCFGLWFYFFLFFFFSLLFLLLYNRRKKRMESNWPECLSPPPLCGGACPLREPFGHGVLHRVHRNLTSAGFSASSVEKYHYPSDCHCRSGGKPDFRSGVIAHTPKRRSHGVPIFGLSSEIMSQVSVYSVFKVHEEAPERSQELTPSPTLNKGWVLAGCFSKS